MTFRLSICVRVCVRLGIREGTSTVPLAFHVQVQWIGAVHAVTRRRVYFHVFLIGLFDAPQLPIVASVPLLLFHKALMGTILETGTIILRTPATRGEAWNCAAGPTQPAGLLLPPLGYDFCGGETDHPCPHTNVRREP